MPLKTAVYPNIEKALFFDLKKREDKSLGTQHKIEIRMVIGWVSLLFGIFLATLIIPSGYPPFQYLLNSIKVLRTKLWSFLRGSVTSF